MSIAFLCVLDGQRVITGSYKIMFHMHWITEPLLRRKSIQPLKKPDLPAKIVKLNGVKIIYKTIV